MKVVVRAFNGVGYYRDILLMDERQVWKHDVRISENMTQSALSGLIGIGVGIEPIKFPEMVRFDVIIRD